MEKAISRQARKYIKDQIRALGFTTVDDVAQLVAPHYSFDPIKAREREIKAHARRMLASVRDEDGKRAVLAVKNSPGRYINIDNCKDAVDVQRVLEQLMDKRDGLNISIRKGMRRYGELAGQRKFEQTKAV